MYLLRNIKCIKNISQKGQEGNQVLNCTPYCETQRLTDQKLSSPIFPCCRPASVTCFRPYKPYIF